MPSMDNIASMLDLQKDRSPGLGKPLMHDKHIVVYGGQPCYHLLNVNEPFKWNTIPLAKRGPFSLANIPVDWPKIIQIKPLEFLLIGGEDNLQEDPEPTNSCYVLNIETNELKKIASMK